MLDLGTQHSEKENKKRKMSGRKQNKNEIEKQTIQHKVTLLNPARDWPWMLPATDEILNYLNTGKVCLVQKCTTMFETIAELIC